MADRHVVTRRARAPRERHRRAWCPVVGRPAVVGRVMVQIGLTRPVVSAKGSTVRV